MNALVQYHVAPIVRSNLDFKLADVPRYWFAGDPFLTRMFDALSLTFPDGERYFIQSVRLFRDQIQDPDLNNVLPILFGKKLSTALHTTK